MHRINDTDPVSMEYINRLEEVKKKLKKKALAQAAVRVHRNYSSFESEVSLERSRVQFSPSLGNFPKRCCCPLADVEEGH